MSQLTEGELQGAVVALAKTCGWRIAHFRPAMSRRGHWSTPMQGDAGWPDLVLVGHGRILYRELKARGNRLQPNQEAWRDVLLEAGCDWALWTEADWPERIQVQLERIDSIASRV